MAITTSKEILLAAQDGGYAVGAFNVENMEMAIAVAEAAEEMKSPVIMQTTPSTLRYAKPAIFAAMISGIAQQCNVPVVLHLDHGSNVGLARECVSAGYTSIMIDGSTKPFEENISITQKTVKLCSAFKIPVEAELGTVGGKEDDTQARIMYTDPAYAVRMECLTGIDSLAVAIGTAHGIYKDIPVLNKELLAEIKTCVCVPLVLHGASGLPDSDVRECIELGICKVNFATELRMAFMDGVRHTLQKDMSIIDPKTAGMAGREGVRKLVIEKIGVCGSAGKA